MQNASGYYTSMTGNNTLINSLAGQTIGSVGNPVSSITANELKVNSLSVSSWNVENLSVANSLETKDNIITLGIVDDDDNNVKGIAIDCGATNYAGILRDPGTGKIVFVKDGPTYLPSTDLSGATLNGIIANDFIGVTATFMEGITAPLVCTDNIIVRNVGKTTNLAVTADNRAAVTTGLTSTVFIPQPAVGQSNSAFIISHPLANDTTQTIDSPLTTTGTLTAPNVMANSFILGTSTALTNKGTGAVVTRAYNINRDIASCDFLMTAGDQKVIGIKNFSAGVKVSSLTVGETTTIVSGNTLEGKTFTIPGDVNSCDFLMCDGPQTIIGNKTFNTDLITNANIYASSGIAYVNCLSAGVTPGGPTGGFTFSSGGGIAAIDLYALGNTTNRYAYINADKKIVSVDLLNQQNTWGSTQIYSSRVVLNGVMDSGNACTFNNTARFNGGVTFALGVTFATSSAVTFLSPPVIKGVIDGSNAAPGNVGEFLIGVTSLISVDGTQNYVTRIQMSLGPGVYNIVGCGSWYLNSGSSCVSYLVINETANSSTGATVGDSIMLAFTPVINSHSSCSINLYRNINANTTFYLNSWETTGCNFNFRGKISAYRLR